ncbi:hypothetical protein [Methylomonas rapida]|uniref:Uncharacterized protein n=1 Tax=Methylomonas rapida TaxID=2963939 RepID=A0ABY7GJB9_9GAMM|nr:hypothetical protein [Methylomonas rapida]WAR44579.1 hypothetical protein NM686_019870 [Methylomonas rapida]
MDRYRKIDWNNERRTIKDKNEKFKIQDIHEPIKPREKSTPKRKERYFDENKLFLPIFLAIVTAAAVIGGFKLYWDYLERQALERDLKIASEQFKKEMENIQRESTRYIKKTFPKQQNSKPQKPEPVCKPTKIDNVWQMHCE